MKVNNVIFLKEKSEHKRAIFSSLSDTPYCSLHSPRLETADNSILSAQLTQCQNVRVSDLWLPLQTVVNNGAIRPQGLPCIDLFALIGCKPSL